MWINNDGDRLYLYDLELVNINASPPSAATTPNPVDGSTVDLSTIDDGVNLFYVFTWSDGATGDVRQDILLILVLQVLWTFTQPHLDRVLMMDFNYQV